MGTVSVFCSVLKVPVSFLFLQKNKNRTETDDLFFVYLFCSISVFKITIFFCFFSNCFSSVLYITLLIQE
jgi:hypothetical protein